MRGHVLDVDAVACAADIGIADVVRAVGRLQPADANTIAAVIGLLGFGLATPGQERQSTGNPNLGTEDTPDVEPDLQADETPVKQLVPIAYDSEAVGTETQWQAAEPVEELPRDLAAAPLPHAPLLEPSRTPSILAAAASTIAEEDALDTDQLVKVLCSGQPVEDMPYLRRRSLVRGVQLLIDHGKGMEPFARDQLELSSALERVVGRSAVTQASFRNSPTRGVLPAGEWRWQKRFRPPAPGTPVLAVSDLGLGGPSVYPARARPDEWLGLARLLARRGSALVTLVPYPEDRWPLRIAAAFTVLPWDRSTTLSTVLSALRKADRPR